MHPDIHHHAGVFSSLGQYLKQAATALRGDSVKTDIPSPSQFFYEEARKCPTKNPWFTTEEIARAVDGFACMLQPGKLNRWVQRYPSLNNGVKVPKTIAVIMAGNIPLVGFHDFLCVLMSGHRFLGKLSSQDDILPLAAAELLTTIDRGLAGRIAFTKDTISDADAIIATGSDNTARYFEYYFGRHPNIIRNNRNAMAILTGKESRKELELLGEDVFSYFGLGCRNVSHIMIPDGYDLSILTKAWKPFDKVLTNQKYHHNYQYRKALFSVDETSYTDAGSCLLVESKKVASPVAVLHYSHYKKLPETEAFIRTHHHQLQCVVAGNDFPTQGFDTIPFGKSQQPDLWDYADGLDTMQFLLDLS